MSKIPPHAKIVFSGILHDVYQWQQEMFDGSFQTFEGLSRRDAVTTLAVTADNKIIINYEEQPGVKAFVSLPGGNSEGTDLLNDAQRELEEETGYTSSEWKIWFSSDILYYEKMDWNNNFFIAKGCTQTSPPANDPGEKIETKLVTFEEFIDITQLPEFRNGEIKRKVYMILNDPDKDSLLEDFRTEIFE
jgi:ADP-ribose pyrophosphatase